MTQLKFKRLHADAIAPTYATDGSACFDLYTWHTAYTDRSAGYVALGLSFEIPPGHAMFVFSRSGHGFRHATRLANCVGVIDSDYRGEVRVQLRYDGSDDAAPSFSPGSRIAQACILPVERVELVEVDDLSSTARGEGGFGSTGE